jgi:hypothetical protein
MTQPDPEIWVQDIAEFVDPIIVAPFLDLELVENDHIAMMINSYQTLVAGIQVHVCLACDPNMVYLVDRPEIVDENGLCLVCGGETN